MSESDRSGLRGGWPTRIGEILQPALGGIGARIFTEARLRKAWLDAVGEQVASHAQVKRLRGDVLEVWVTSDSWATELTYLSAALIEKLNEQLGAGTVAQIVVQRKRKERHF